jgi:hypothetical protein
MAKKRGGIAGLYDKSKGFLKVAAPVGLSFIPGVGIPLAAAAGAALGADTEGRKFFDRRNIGGAIRGGLEGASLGAGTQGVRAMLTGGGPLAGTVPKIGGGGAKGAAKLTADGIPRMPLGLTGTEPAQSMKFTQALLQPQVLSGAVQGGLSMLPDAKSAAMEEQTKLGQGQLDLQKAQFEEEKRRAQMEEERKRRIAELLMPYIQQQYGSYFGGR